MMQANLNQNCLIQALNQGGLPTLGTSHVCLSSSTPFMEVPRRRGNGLTGQVHAFLGSVQVNCLRWKEPG